jgi:hypothetical protein
MDVSDESYYLMNKMEITVAKWGKPKKYLKKHEQNNSNSK